MTTKTVVEKAVQRAQAKTEAQPVERRWAYLDSIARAKQHSDILRRQQEIRSAEASLNVRPINITGQIDQHMTSQVAQQIAQKREELRYVESLADDQLVAHYCAGEIAQNEMPFTPELRNSDGSPLKRGAVGAGVVPGMFSAVNG